MYHLIVSGTAPRNGLPDLTDVQYAAFADVLNLGEILRISHGAAKGIDQFADTYAQTNDIPCDRYYADWQRYGKAAGPRRNREMIESTLRREEGQGTPILHLGFVTHLRSRGTLGALAISREYGIPTRLFMWDAETQKFLPHTL